MLHARIFTLKCLSCVFDEEKVKKQYDKKAIEIEGKIAIGTE